MKIFFDTNVYVAEALWGVGSRRIVAATRKARWRQYTSEYVLGEVAHVLVDDLGFGRRLAWLTRRRIARRCRHVKPRSQVVVPADPKDSPILQAALTCGADYLVTNDRHLLAMDPTQGLRIVSMDAYQEVLRVNGLIP